VQARSVQQRWRSVGEAGWGCSYVWVRRSASPMDRWFGGVTGGGMAARGDKSKSYGPEDWG
jgi:hypothetical protein